MGYKGYRGLQLREVRGGDQEVPGVTKFYM